MNYAIFRFVAWLLRRWADYAHVELDRERRHEIKSLKSDLEVERSENERLALKHARWCEMEKTETAILVNKRAIAEGSSMRPE